MNLGISGKRCLITGACSGIGAEITRSMLEEGATVLGTARSYPNEFIDSLNSSEKSRFLFAQAELSTRDGVEKLILNEDFDFDIVINNAGHTCDITDPFCDADDWASVMQLNFLSPVAIATASVPHMKRRNWGRIVNITSCAGLENSGPVTFTSAKAALTAYTRSMGRVLAIESQGIVMTAVYPGVIVTQGGHWDTILKEDPDRAKKYLSDRCPAGRFGEISEFVPTVMFFASQHASFAHGSIVGIDGGQSRHFTQASFEP